VLAAVKALAESNIFSLRLSQVAKVAGVPQSLVDYHFKSLEDLVMMMVLYQLNKLKQYSIEAIERNSTDPRKAMAAYIHAPFELAGSDKGFRTVWASYYHLATVHPQFAQLNRMVREGGQDRIQMLVQNIVVREGRAIEVPRQTTSRIASAIQGLITGCAIIASAETDGDFATMAKVTSATVDQLIDSTFPKV
jgi:AcrR family transcriptional regulator